MFADLPEPVRGQPWLFHNCQFAALSQTLPGCAYDSPSAPPSRRQVTLSSFSSGSLNEAAECLTFEREICVRLSARLRGRTRPLSCHVLRGNATAVLTAWGRRVLAAEPVSAPHFQRSGWNRKIKDWQTLVTGPQLVRQQAPHTVRRETSSIVSSVSFVI